MTVEIIEGDCLAVLSTLAEKSVHCVVTSPPYWGLRDYGVAGQMGLEKTPEEYVAKMVVVFREVRRVLRDDGTCWVNMGDAYAHNGACGGSSPDGNREYRATDKLAQEKMVYRVPPGLKPKDLCGIPWRLAFALQADGWYLRSDIIWAKPNPMPESVTDRPTKSHEYVFLLSKSASYYYDAEAVKEPQSDLTLERISGYKNKSHQTTDAGEWKHVAESAFGDKAKLAGKMQHRIEEGGRNKRTVWTINEPQYRLRHDISDADRLYVLGELSRRGLSTSIVGSTDGTP